jgi:hypothetical protein
MLNYIFNTIGGNILHYTGKLSSKEWMIASAICVALGFIMTQGFAGRGRI